MDFDFTVEEMIQRLAEFPPKDLKEKISTETKKINFYYTNSELKENIYNYVASLPEAEIRNTDLALKREKLENTVRVAVDSS